MIIPKVTKKLRRFKRRHRHGLEKEEDNVSLPSYDEAIKEIQEVESLADNYDILPKFKDVIIENNNNRVMIPTNEKSVYQKLEVQPLQVSGVSVNQSPITTYEKLVQKKKQVDACLERARQATLTTKYDTPSCIRFMSDLTSATRLKRKPQSRPIDRGHGLKIQYDLISQNEIKIAKHQAYFKVIQIFIAISMVYWIFTPSFMINNFHDQQA